MTNRHLSAIRIPLAGDNNHLRFGGNRQQLVDDGQAIAVGQPDIQEDNVKGPVNGGAQALSQGIGGARRMVETGKFVGNGFGKQWVIIDYEYLSHTGNSPAGCGNTQKKPFISIFLQLQTVSITHGVR
jgi:hypothetical protein